MAEIFILILFLLLLLLVALYDLYKTEEGKNTKLEDKLEKTTSLIKLDQEKYIVWDLLEKSENMRKSAEIRLEYIEKHVLKDHREFIQRIATLELALAKATSELERTGKELEAVTADRNSLRSKQPSDIRDFNNKIAEMADEIEILGKEREIYLDLLQKIDDARNFAEIKVEHMEQDVLKDHRQFIERIATLEQALTKATGELERTGKELEAVTADRNRMRSKQPSDIRKFNLEIARMKDELIVLENEKSRFQNLFQKSEEQLKFAETTISELQKTPKEKIHSRGRDAREGSGYPPCWYKTENRQGSPHKKPYYLLNIAVRDEHLRIKLREAPEGRADDNGQRAQTTYEEEYAKLPLGRIREVRNFTDPEFLEAMEPIHRMGKNRKIRSHPCVFWAKIWDETSPTAKKRWQEAENTIQSVFHTYRVKNPVREDRWQW